MEMSTLHVYISFILLSQYKLLLAQTGETTLELSFAANPVLPGSQAVLQCKVWGDIPKEQVGISRYNNNGMNTVVFRNGDLLQDGPEHFSLDIFPDDGSTSYHVTVAGVDRVTDGGMYSCYVLDEEGGLQAILATKLEVTPQHLLPICSSLEGKVVYITESEITLTCTAQDATSTVSKMQWIRDDEINVPTNQSTTREGNTVITTLTKTLSQTDDGVSFKCILLTEDLAVLSGRECSIGPITVQSSNDTVKVSRIAGLSVTVFIIVIVFACVAFIACAIVLIVCCLRCCCNQSSSISRSSSKSYSMTGISSRGESTIRREGTLTGGRESYHPARPAPPPPTSTQQPNGDVSQDNITPDRPLSAVEAALLLTISQSLARNQNTPYNPRGNSSATDTEIIYANTNELNAIPEEENDDHGVVNPAYVGSNGPALFMVKQPTRQPVSLSAQVPQQQTEYYNTMELGVMPSSDKSSLQIDNKPKPVPLPKPTANGISDKPVPIPKPTSSASPLRPIPVAKPRTSAPPSKPVPVAKPVINPNGMPIRPVPVLKPVSNDISTRPVPPSKPIKMVNEVSANAARPDAAPVPPPKPTYEITEDRPVNMVKMVNEVNSANAARPAAAPVPPPKPTYEITEDRPVKRVNEVSPNAARPAAAAPVPPPKPTYEITEGRPVPPLKPVSKPTVDISESRPAPPPKPLPKPTSETEDNRPAPPPKPTYEI